MELVPRWSLIVCLYVILRYMVVLQVKKQKLIGCCYILKTIYSIIYNMYNMYTTKSIRAFWRYTYP